MSSSRTKWCQAILITGQNMRVLLDKTMKKVKNYKWRPPNNRKLWTFNKKFNLLKNCSPNKTPWFLNKTIPLKIYKWTSRSWKLSWRHSKKIRRLPTKRFYKPTKKKFKRSMNSRNSAIKSISCKYSRSKLSFNSKSRSRMSICRRMH